MACIRFFLLLLGLEQLILHLEYQDAVKIHSIAFQAPEDGMLTFTYIYIRTHTSLDTAPRVFKLFVNRTNLVCPFHMSTYRNDPS